MLVLFFELLLQLLLDFSGVQNDKMIRFGAIVLFVYLFGTLKSVDGLFFGNADCPEVATFFEASNSTTDCNGAMPISTFGLKGDKFCENICSGVSLWA